MTTQYTPILQLALPVTGELNGTWGDVVNDNITSMVEEAIAGLATISTWVANSHTLTTADGTTDEARCAMLVATSTTAASEIICPARTKLFVLKNSSSYAVTLKTAAGTGVAVAAGETAFLFCDGTNVNACVTTIVNGHITGNLTVDGNAQVNGNTTLGDAVGDTVTINGTTTFTNANPTLSQGTAGRVLFLNGSKVIADAAGLTWDGTTLSATKLAGAFNGTVGATTPSTGVFTQVDITAQGDLRLQDSAGGEYVALQAPATVPASYTLTMPDTDGDAGQALITDGSGNLSWSTAASGDVYGPASATDNAVARFDGTAGKLIQNSTVTIGDDGATVIAANSTSDGLRITQTGTGNALVVEDSANPDSTPFVVTGDGRVVIGFTYGMFSGASFIIGNDNNTTRAHQVRYGATTNPAEYIFNKSRSTAFGSNAIVSSGDSIGSILFRADDGANYIETASISAAVDGTPGTNDMPGRLVFGTTADGASSPTERMRIDSAGAVGIGTTSLSGYSLRVGKNLTGGTFAFGVAASGQVQSDVTGGVQIFRSNPTVVDASFTIPNLSHFATVQGTKGASATITNLYGFNADSALTSATNNYGFYSNIAYNTGRWNFYAAGTADNYFAGRLGLGGVPNYTLDVQGASARINLQPTAGTDTAFIRFSNTGGNSFFGIDNSVGGLTSSAYAMVAYQAGAYPFIISTNATERMRIDSAGNVGVGTTSLTARRIGVGGTVTGATTAYGVLSQPTFQSDVTATANNYYSGLNTQATAFTLSTYNHFNATQATIGAGSTVTNQIGFNATSGLTGATNNYGFYGNIASGTGRYNFYAAGSADNYFSGRVSIGTVSGGNTNLYVEKSITGGTSAGNIASFGRVQSDVTGTALGISTYLGTAAASFTLSNLAHFNAQQWSFDSGSAVTNQFGFRAESGLTGATNNYGFYGNIAAGTGRYNFYAAGSADNYFAGSVGIGSTSLTGKNLVISKTITGSTTGMGTYVNSAVQSDVTGSAYGFASDVTTAAASFTLGSLIHFRARGETAGAGSTITSQSGFQAEATLTGATNNYGFYSNIASGTGRYNFYAAGSAPNYFAGAVTIVGALTVTDPVVQQSDIGTAPNEVPVNGYLGDLAFQNKEGFVITPAASATPNGIGDMTFELTNNTTLVVKVKGSDGTVRSATLTLA